MEDDGSTTVNSTKIQLDEFKESLVWKDIVEELNVWKKGFEIEMANIVDNAAEENPSTASVLMHMGNISGRIKAVGYIKDLPDMFLEILKMRVEENKDK